VVKIRSRADVYVEPTLAAEIEYRAWTSDGKVRHASFKGIRDPSDDVAIYELPD
jgi:bifunctional non-homologous end joining protein LigD